MDQRSDARAHDLTATTETALVELSGFAKTFATRTVLRDFDLTLAPGEIHGLVGHNGSGKSTLIKLLSGFHEPDAGARLVVRGTAIDLPLRPGMSRRLGFGFVHQDLGLVETGTVLENLLIGRFELGRGLRIRWGAERKRVAAELEWIGLRVAPDAQISELSQVDRALVAILRALEQLRSVPRGLLVLDEPTAYLPRPGVDRLFSAVRDVSARGHAVLFVTHKLEEVLGLADRVTVLRDGQRTAQSATAGLTEQQLVEWILGHEADVGRQLSHDPTGPTLLAVDGLTGRGIEDLSLNVAAGEVVGVTGLLGSGADELPYMLFGAKRAAGGHATIAGKRLDLATLRPVAAIEAGLALMPANRARDGGVAGASLLENLTLPTLGRYWTRGRLRHRPQESRVTEMLRLFDVTPPEPHRPFGTLSGGNQQKALLAKWFERRPDLFLVHEPVQGVDVGARVQILAHIRTAAAEGMSFLLVSVEYEDLVEVCDRVLVMRRGRVGAELSGDELTVDRVAAACLAPG
jgi:ribose transport system ATP-binding protein